MKKNLVIVIIFIFLFTFSCTFNLFEGSVEQNYKSIKKPAEKIEYARQILASGNSEKISKIIKLLKDDIEANPPVFEGDLLISAKQLVGNLLISESGFNDFISNAISTMISSSENNETPDLITALVDSNGDGNITEEDLNSLKDMLTNIAQAAEYINEAAQANHENLDLQLQNVIANLAAAVVTISNLQPEQFDQLSNYLENGGTPPSFWNDIANYFTNAESSVNNILENSDQNSFYYSIASSLSSIFSNIH